MPLSPTVSAATATNMRPTTSATVRSSPGWTWKTRDSALTASLPPPSKEGCTTTRLRRRRHDGAPKVPTMLACPACGATNPLAARFCNACGASLEPEAPEDRGRSSERRVVTMLFCDVRGSTAMAETLDAEEWTDVMNLAYEQLIEPVIRHEGTVARLMGDAILAFFGAPTAHEDDPQRAVMAGLEIVSAIGPVRERLARERGLDLEVRVGINTGSVVVGQVGSALRQEYTAMGDAVNVAARMEQTAEPGTVQITEDTYRLVADLFDVEALGGIELKGKREPVSAYRVRGRLDAPWKVRAARSLEGPLVGREAEMAVVRSALERVREGVGSVVLIVGEPGIGKSRLVEEANTLWAELEPDDERPWDFWYCVPYDAMQPYAQYRRLIRERAGIVEADSPDAMRAKIAETIAAHRLRGMARAQRARRARAPRRRAGGRGAPRRGGVPARGDRARRRVEPRAGRAAADRVRGPPLVRPGLARAGQGDHPARAGPPVRLPDHLPPRPERTLVGVQGVGRVRARPSDGAARAGTAHRAPERAADRRAPAGRRDAGRPPPADPREDGGEPAVRPGGGPIADRRAAPSSARATASGSPTGRPRSRSPARSRA